MNRTTTILLLVFIILGLGTWWYTQNSGPKNTLGSDRDWYMAVDNLDEVHKVFFANRNGKKVTFERQGKGWVYNGKHKARPNAVDLVLDVVKNIRLKYRPPQPAVEPAVRYIAGNGIKVEVYNKAGDNLRTFYVGGGTTDERGTYMMLDGSDNPYVMHLPAWEGNIRTRFFFGDSNWRDKTVLAAKPEKIQKIAVEYPKQRKQSFILERANGDTDEFTVAPFYDANQKQATNKSKVKNYLYGFKSLGAEAFENDNPNLEKLTSDTPFCMLSLTTTDGKSKTITAYPLLHRDENDQPILDEKVERYILKSSTGDYYLIQQLVFGKIFWAKDAFLP